MTYSRVSRRLGRLRISKRTAERQLIADERGFRDGLRLGFGLHLGTGVIRKPSRKEQLSTWASTSAPVRAW